jgi:hypothetical protein
MKRKIVVETGECNELAKLFGCSLQMVSYSLNFKKNSLLARKIRAAAIKRGGVDISGLVSQKGDSL